nr:MAG TPA: hypothetical protein [Caudoviricetes sp.]
MLNKYLVHLKEITDYSNVNGSDTSTITTPIIITPTIIILISLVKFPNLKLLIFIIGFKPVCAITSTIYRHTRAMSSFSGCIIVSSIPTHFLSNVNGINVNRSIIGKSRSYSKSTTISTNSQVSNKLRFTPTEIK